MIKKMSFTFMTLFVTFTASAQLKVVNTGQTYMGTSTPTTQATLSVDHNDGYNYYQYSFGVSAHHQSTQTFNIGIKAVSTMTTCQDRTIGLQGLAGGGASGWNYGVVGGLAYPTGNGAGIYGTLLNHTGVEIPGRYAGYFDGPTRVDGTMTATSFITSSDIRLKENIQSVSETTCEGGTLDNILSMNVIKYNYKERALSQEVTDTLSTHDTSTDKQPSATHYGLSAQELQQIYPDLVYEGQDGYLGVNYVELVPILIRSIQELKAELDEMKGTNGSARKAPQTNKVVDSAIKQASLYQNTPNPFTAQTEIRFSLPDNAKDTFICISDMQGKMLKQIPVDYQIQSISVNGGDFPAGIYFYSLVTGGKMIDTKRMIVSK